MGNHLENPWHPGKAVFDFYENAPFFFTVEFDSEKARKQGMTTAELLNRVDRIATGRGMARIAENAWQAFHKTRQAKFSALEPTLTELSQSRWFMDAVTEWMVFDNESPWGDDMIALAQEVPLAFID